jgi:DNA-binding transcriptional LysR family regulator
MRSSLPDKFSVLFPALQVEFIMSDKLVDLGKGQADIAIRAAAPTDNALVGRKIAASHGLFMPVAHMWIGMVVQSAKRISSTTPSSDSMAR